MPGLQSANISAKLLKELGHGTVLGPFLVGMAKPVQIAAMTSTASDLTTMAVLAAAGLVRLRPGHGGQPLPTPSAGGRRRGRQAASGNGRWPGHRLFRA